MSPGKPVGAIKVHVPRHNAQRIGTKLSAEVESIARTQGIRTDIPRASHEPTSAINLAIESASDWNSLLMTARAERGPQWDIGTQQFQVDEGSELYYDSTLLQESLKQKSEEESSTDREHADFLAGPSDRHSSPQTHRNSNSYQYGSPHMGQRYPNVSPFNAIPTNQFYNGHDASPARMGMTTDGMGISPDVRRRVTRGMTEEGYGMFHGN